MKRLFMTAVVVMITLPVWAQYYGGGFGAGMFGGSTNQQVTVTIKADGTAQIRTETSMARPALEQQMRMMEFYNKQMELEEEGDEGLPAVRQPPEPKPYTDDELAKAIRNTYEKSDEVRNDEATMKVTDVKVAKDTVHLVYVMSLTSLNGLVEYEQAAWGMVGLYFENIKYETDADGRLKLTLKTNAEMMKNWQKQMQRALKLTGARTVLTLVFPGKVVSSSLPVTEGNSTGLVLDGKREETIAAVAKAFATPVTIVAEAGGLKLDKPVDSATVAQSRRQQNAGVYDALPVTEAGAGFISEPVSVTMTTAHLFPGAEKQLQRSQFGYELANTGLVVQAKLFLPKGRTLLAADQPRVVKALDNKGRSLVRPVDQNVDMDMGELMFGGDDKKEVPLQLRLQLPSPDAQTIEEIQVEAIVVTASKWKEQVLTNLQANAETAIDLGSILPGAKLTITKFTNKKGQQNLVGKITGPVGIRQLDVNFKVPDENRGNSNSNDTNYNVKNGLATRTIQVTSYNFEAEEKGDSPPPVLVVRLPEDAHRERVRFVLKGLDLY